MGDTTSRAKVSVALVGVGPTWEIHYRNAIQRLSSKLSVRAVCDAVLNRAVAVADELHATPVLCPWCLTQRHDLHAWLILDPGWFETYPAALAASQGRPALVANTFSSPIPRLIPVIERSMEQGESLMPEFPQRFAPTTTRLRELMATKLGHVQTIDITIPLGEATVESWLHEYQAEAIGLIDWCAWLIGSSISAVESRTTAEGLQLEFQFSTRAAKGNLLPSVAIQFVTTGTSARRVDCERGWVKIDSPTQLTWYNGDAETRETLTHERSPYEIILDQFCRRALGGLVPVPTVRHALHAVTVCQQILSLR